MVSARREAPITAMERGARSGRRVSALVRSVAGGAEGIERRSPSWGRMTSGKSAAGAESNDGRARIGARSWAPKRRRATEDHNWPEVRA